MAEIPDHLLERSRAARARLTGEPPPGAAESEPAAPEPVAPEPVAAAPEPEPVAAVAEAVVGPEAVSPLSVPAVAVEQHVPALAALAFPPPEPPPPGAALEIGVRGLAARKGVAVEPLRPKARTREEGDLVVAAAGVSEYSVTRSPRWLVALYTLIPLFALIYIVQYAEGPKCGDAGALRVSEKDGGLLTCDGEKLGETGPTARRGRAVYNANCATCHLTSGAGSDAGGVGRPLYGQGTLVGDFPDLISHVEFVKGGTAKFPAYGALNRQSTGSMPAFEATLSPFDLVSAVMYERHLLHGGVAEDAPSEVLPPEFAREK